MRHAAQLRRRRHHIGHRRGAIRPLDVIRGTDANPVDLSERLGVRRLVAAKAQLQLVQTRVDRLLGRARARHLDLVATDLHCADEHAVERDRHARSVLADRAQRHEQRADLGVIKAQRDRAIVKARPCRAVVLGGDDARRNIHGVGDAAVEHAAAEVEQLPAMGHVARRQRIDDRDDLIVLLRRHERRARFGAVPVVSATPAAPCEEQHEGHDGWQQTHRPGLHSPSRRR